MTFLIFLFAHLLADYPLQGEFLATMKGKNHIVLVSHACIWTGIIALTAHFIGVDINFLDIAFLFIVHAIADYMKAKPIGFYKKLNPLGWGLFIDQMIHVVQILLLMLQKGLI
ncbi:hypothetical protein BKM15_25900 [Pseudomonas syringae pv. syringae]|nr:hypothetical protein BKM15_25900 [Pseudomonas syringae pv. syringae]